MQKKQFQNSEKNNEAQKFLIDEFGVPDPYILDVVD